jgi:hypothetical protein
VVLRRRRSRSTIFNCCAFTTLCRLFSSRMRDSIL